MNYFLYIKTTVQGQITFAVDKHFQFNSSLTVSNATQFDDVTDRRSVFIISSEKNEKSSCEMYAVH